MSLITKITHSRFRPIFGKIRLRLGFFLDRITGPRLAKGASWVIEGNQRINKLQAYPLMAWINYHEREIVAGNCHWLGHRALRNPLDAWIYQEIVFEVKPEGGGAIFLATICEMMGHGRVVAVDLDHSRFTPVHDRIETITGDCSSEEVVSAVREKCNGQIVLIIHDADHTRDAVLRDLRLYGPLVSAGSYIIVEDSIQGVPGYASGSNRNEMVGPSSIPRQNTPLQAIEQYLKEDKSFEVDESRERYILTENHRGFLKKVA